MTLTELRENWEEYTIYYSFRSDSRPSAIMFNPKNNGKKLVGDNWYKIEDQKRANRQVHPDDSIYLDISRRSQKKAA